VIVCLSGDDRIHGHADEKGFDPGFKLFGKTIPVRPVEEMKQEEPVSVQQPGAHKVGTLDLEGQVESELEVSAIDSSNICMCYLCRNRARKARRKFSRKRVAAARTGRMRV
jgi:hypothetical protein